MPTRRIPNGQLLSRSWKGKPKEIDRRSKEIDGRPKGTDRAPKTVRTQTI